MSRRGRHGRQQHSGSTRPGGPAPERQAGTAEARPGESRVVAPIDRMPSASVGPDPAERVPAPGRAPAAETSPVLAPRAAQVAPSPVADAGSPVAVAGAPVPVAEPGRFPADAPDGRPTCTTAQLRRFIKSRPWVPMHELRRRFGIWGGDDDVSPVRVGDKTLYIGLPAAESSMMAELLSGGDVGYELSLDPVTPIVVGVYPMRPVPRS